MRQATQIEVSKGKCPLCDSEVSFAAKRGFCKECFVTFAKPPRSRADVCSEFQIKFFMSKNSGFYHREGCKYLRNVTSENLIVTSEPFGRACSCIQRGR